MIIRHGAAGAIRLGGCSGRKRDLMTATVLLVEDERKLRELVRSYLERAGFMVLSTGSGAEAISLVSSAAPDLVVLDLGLPDVPGETVAQEVRAAGATPILVLTAKSAEEDRIAGRPPARPPGCRHVPAPGPQPPPPAAATAHPDAGTAPPNFPASDSCTSTAMRIPQEHRSTSETTLYFEAGSNAARLLPSRQASGGCA